SRLRGGRHAGPHRPDPPLHGLRHAPAALCRGDFGRHRQRARCRAGRLDRGARRGVSRATGWFRLSRRHRLYHPHRRAPHQAHGPLRGARLMLDLLAYAAFFLVTALTYGIICLGLNVQWGQTGLFNVGVAGFVAIGAYTSALLTTPDAAGRFGGFGLPIWLGWIAAALLSGAVAAIIGAITLRLRADYLAITTFGIAIAIQLVALNAETLTGGPFGVGFIPRAFAGFEDRPVIFNLANLFLVGLITALLYYGLERLLRSPWGRVLRAIREDEAAAQSLGKNVNLFR